MASGSHILKIVPKIGDFPKTGVIRSNFLENEKRFFNSVFFLPYYGRFPKLSNILKFSRAIVLFIRASSKNHWKICQLANFSMRVIIKFIYTSFLRQVVPMKKQQRTYPIHMKRSMKNRHQLESYTCPTKRPLNNPLRRANGTFL